MEQVEIINKKGEVVNSFQLNSPLWQVPLSRWNVSLVNRHYLFNQRQGTSKTLSRGEITGSTRKIYRQKGTGGARHGARNAPQFVGGGVSFGPRGESNFSLKVNKKLSKKVLQSILGERMRKKEILVVDNLNFDNYKTKEAEKFLHVLPVKKVKTLMVLSENDENKQKIICAFRNLPYINITNNKLLNTYELLSPKYVIFTHSALTQIQERLS